MFGYFLDPAKRLKKRFERAQKALIRLQESGDRIIDSVIQASVLRRVGKLAVKAERLADRIEELPLVRARSFDWLREDIDKQLVAIETEIDHLQEETKPLALRSSAPKQLADPSSPPLSNSKDQPAQSVEPKHQTSSPTPPTKEPLPKEGAPVARIEPTRTNPADYAGKAPNGSGHQRRHQRTKEAASSQA